MDDGGPTASYIIFFVLLLIDMLFYGFGAAVRELSAKELSEEFKDTKNKVIKRKSLFKLHQSNTPFAHKFA